MTNMRPTVRRRRFVMGKQAYDQLTGWPNDPAIWYLARAPLTCSLYVSVTSLTAYGACLTMRNPTAKLSPGPKL
jgi:hypothetical protein